MYQQKYNPDFETGEILSDISQRGREKPWRLLKQGCEYLTSAYSDLGQDKRAERCDCCGARLLFLECPVDNFKKLKAANFCKDRLCPACQDRRSLRQFATSVKIGHEVLRQYPTYKFLFLTLTVRSVTLDNLESEIRRVFAAWKKLMKRREVDRAVKGYLRVLEVSYNDKREEVDGWHPHIHAVVVVPTRYFTTDIYIKRDRWLQLWQESMQDELITQVDIRRVKVSKKKQEEEGIDPTVVGFAELSKYSLKTWSKSSKMSHRQLMKQGKDLTRDIEGHIWLRKTAEETAVVVEKLQDALRHKQLVQYGGILRDVKKELKIKDGEDEGADLVHTNDVETACSCPICGGTMEEHMYIYDKVLRDYVG